MKATIHGIEVEGTPQEILLFKQMMDAQSTYVTKPTTGTGALPWWPWKQEFYCNSGKVDCTKEPLAVWN